MKEKTIKNNYRFYISVIALFVLMTFTFIPVSAKAATKENTYEYTENIVSVNSEQETDITTEQTEQIEQAEQAETIATLDTIQETLSMQLIIWMMMLGVVLGYIAISRLM